MCSAQNTVKIKNGLSLNIGQIKGYQTLREKILTVIREAICTGQLKPGEKVVEPELAKQFGISRTPIREAFRQLESEGYLQVVPRKGVVVAKLSQRDMKEYFAIKGVLEGYAAQIASQILTDKELDRLEILAEKLLQSAARNDANEHFRERNEFHEIFLVAAGNHKLYEMIQQLEAKFSRLRLLSLKVDGRMAVSASECGLIVSAFKEKNGRLAETLVTQSVATCCETLLSR